MFSLKPKMPEVNDLLPGRSAPMAITGQHYVNGAKLPTTGSIWAETNIVK